MIMMRCFIKPLHCFTNLLVVSPFCCNSFSTSQHPFLPEKQHHHVHYNPSSHTGIRTSTFLSAGREQRISSSKEIDPAEQKLIANEETVRQKRLGQLKQRLHKSVSREDRISILELKLKKAESMPESESAEYMTKPEREELKGLQNVREKFEEQYDPLTFTEEHLEFKTMHNDAFIQLSRYCERERNRLNFEKESTRTGTSCEEEEPVLANVFFLDGPDGGTASALIHRGEFDASQCFVANRHESSCESLRISGGGMLPDENVVHATAAEALTITAPISLEGVEGKFAGKDNVDVASFAGEDGALAHVDFAAYYFDGCGGFVPHIVGMLSAALLRKKCDASRPIAVGYSLLGGNKDVVAKELVVSRALTIIARKRGMRMVHVLDDPLRYGISSGVEKVGGSGGQGGGTFTTWLLLQPED